MTTSTDNNQQENPSLPELPPEPVKKKEKKKGPIRFEAIGLILLLSAGAYGYTHFFFDSHLRATSEWIATKIYGAEINIGKIETSFLSGKFSLKGLQVTNKDDPKENIIQVGEIRLGFLWDALLRAKFVIEDASIENIQAFSPRKKPGRILPKEETAIEEVKNNETVQEFENAVIAKGKKEFNGNVVGDVASILGGADPSSQLKEFSEELESEKKIKATIDEIDGKQKEWEEKIEKVTNKKEFDEIVTRAKNYKFNNKNPIKSLKELQDILKNAQDKINQFNKTSNEIKEDVNKYITFASNVDNMIDQDIKTMMNRFNIPDANVGDMSKDIFAEMFLNKLGEYRKYAEMAREVAPPQKKNSSNDSGAVAQDSVKTIQAAPRGVGKTYHFAKKKGYPFFWLKKSSISSKSSMSEFSGDVRGEILNITNEPQLLGIPATINFEGDFPNQKIKGVKGNIIVDRTKQVATDKAQITVAQFPVGDQKFSDSEKLKLELAKAKGESQLDILLEDSSVSVNLQNKFTETEYKVDAQGKEVKEIMTNVVNGIPFITLNANAKGASWSKLKWDISSNFGKELGKGIKSQVEAKINAAKKKVENMVKQKVNEQKAKLEGKLGTLKSEIDSKIASVQSQMDKGKKEIENKVAASKSSSTNKIKKSGKKAIDKLKKKLKIKF